MKKVTPWLLACSAAAILLTGCSTMGRDADAAKGAGEPAVMCGKCQAVWVSRPNQINKSTVYRKVKTMSCPDCDSAVENFFKTSKFEHTCKTCGDSLMACPLCK